MAIDENRRTVHDDETSLACHMVGDFKDHYPCGPKSNLVSVSCQFIIQGVIFRVLLEDDQASKKECFVDLHQKLSQ